jgi:competence protein ComEA
VVVHVSGWVVAPGVVTIPEGSIVADAIGAAGGAKPGAALDRINLSRLVLDGELIEVPGPDSTEPAGGTNDDGLISLNRATVSELESLPGVGQVLAERIVAFRDANGSFSTVEDLLDVSGIGEAKLASIRDLVTLP